MSCGSARTGCECCSETADSFKQVAQATTEDGMRAMIEKLVARGALCADPEPRVFVYRIARDGKRQLGTVAVVDRADLEPAPSCTDAIPAWAEPATALFDDPEGVLAALALGDTNERPIFHFNAGDGTTHSAWLVHDARRYVEAFAQLPGVARLVEPGPSDGQGRMLALLLDRSQIIDPLPLPRCGLFVQRTLLAP